MGRPPPRRATRIRAALEADGFESTRCGPRLRGRGLLQGIELRHPATGERFAKSERISGRVARAARERGLMIYSCPTPIVNRHMDAVMLAPPLIISDAEIDEMLEKLEGGRRRRRERRSDRPVDWTAVSAVLFLAVILPAHPGHAPALVAAAGDGARGRLGRRRRWGRRRGAIHSGAPAAPRARAPRRARRGAAAARSWEAVGHRCYEDDGRAGTARPRRGRAARGTGRGRGSGWSDVPARGGRPARAGAGLRRSDLLAALPDHPPCRGRAA